MVRLVQLHWDGSLAVPRHQLLVLTNCGYRFSPGGEWIDKSLQTVFVDNIANTTSEPFIEIYLRNGLEDQFRKSSRFRLATSKDTAARAAFVIDKQGVVKYSEQTPTPKELPNFANVKQTLAKLN